MRAIISSDWQCEHHNIDHCKIAWKFVLEQCKKHSLEAIMLAGDLKASYNPVDIYVIKWWQRAITEATTSKYRVIVLLGNHDRINLHTDSQNWLSILRKAGAEVFDKPGTCELMDGKLAMLPFTTGNKLLRERSDYLAKQEWNKWKDILLFHADVSNCKYNQFGTRSESKLKYEELHPEKYLACVGGHIHLPQELGKNGYYVGSPFAMDYGECNQKKRFILVLSSDIRSIDSPMPGWFDDSWPNFYTPKTWKESRVRIHVKVEVGRSYIKVLDRAKKIAEREYPGAIIKVVPEFENKVENEVKVQIQDNDEKKITSYIKETLPERLIKKENQVTAFLISKLKEADRLRRHGSQALQFVEFKGKNVLSFKKIRCVYEKQGLVVIEGKNKDWNSQSNGTGKTNASQMIPVALFGTTFKGQKFDRWARRGIKDRAEAELTFTNESGNEIKIVRCRRPNWIQLMVNGVDHSSGMNKGNNEDGTQARIESITGFTWQTLANSLYIDKTVANAFLSGKKSDRIDLLYRFQNLERFDRALTLVRKYKQRHNTSLEQTRSAIDILKTRVIEAKQYLEKQEKDAGAKIKKLRKDYKELLSKWRVLHHRKIVLSRLADKTYRKNKPRYEAVAKKSVALEKQIDELKPRIWKAEQTIQRHKNLAEKGKCQTCGTKVDKKQHVQNLKEAEKHLQITKGKLYNIEKYKRAYNEQCALLEGEIDKSSIDAGEAKTKADLALDNLRWMKKQISELKESEQSSVKEMTNKLKDLKEELNEFREYHNHIEGNESFIQYCEEAFSKDGLPAFLNSQLCPVLNKACEEYSDLFCDKEIMVQFKMDEGDLVPQILNAHGGENLNDQSKGESTMAGIVTSFALKEIAPRTNVLFLDEPEEGLTTVNIRKFANGLKQLKNRFESIFLITHNPTLLSELAGEKVIKIVKRNGVSQVI